MPHRVQRGGKAVGTLLIDKRYRGVGRVRVASGTVHTPTYRAIVAAFDTLYQRGRLDLLIAVRDKRLTPLAVLDATRTHRVDALPSADTLLPLAATWTAWLPTHDCGADHRRHLGYALARLTADAGPLVPTVADLPARLAAVRATYQASGHARAFNLTRHAALAFVKATVGDDSPLYAKVRKVAALKVTAKRKKQPLTVPQVDALCATLERVREARDEFGTWSAAQAREAGQLAWTLAWTGMRPSELYGRWYLEGPGVHVVGTKTAAAVRALPKPHHDRRYAWPSGAISAKALAKRVWHASRKEGSGCPPCTLYDLRRSFANWMEAAGIPRTRRRQYLGHAQQDVTDRYESHDVTPHLTADAALLRAWAERQTGPDAPKASDPAPT